MNHTVFVDTDEFVITSTSIIRLTVYALSDSRFFYSVPLEMQKLELDLNHRNERLQWGMRYRFAQTERSLIKIALLAPQHGFSFPCLVHR